jgi:hypothetical protein
LFFLVCLLGAGGLTSLSALLSQILAALSL